MLHIGIFVERDVDHQHQQRQQQQRKHDGHHPMRQQWHVDRPVVPAVLGIHAAVALFGRRRW
jgi:hypothetical protein